jgi:Ca-activated chloride channel family protein
VGDERRRFAFPVTLARAGGGGSYEFVARLWAVRRVGFLIDQIDLHGRNRELIDELVALSTRYGILTPYTSFLADERVPLHARAENAARTTLSLEALDRTSGAAGVGQRDVKQEYFARNQAAPPAAAPALPQDAAVAFGTNPGEKNAAGGQSGPALARAKGNASRPSAWFHMQQPGQALILKDTEGRAALAETVRQVGAKTFYYKDGGWVDSAVDAGELGKAVVVTQFSEAFFTLARNQSAEQNQYLTFADQVTVKLDGKVYRIDPERP